MAKLALVLWLLYFLVFGLRVLLHRRRSGRTGFAGVQGRPETVQLLGEGGQVLAHALGVAALALADVVSPVAALDARAVHVGGIALFTLGLVGVFISQEAMGASWRIGVDRAERTELVRAAPSP